MNEAICNDMLRVILTMTLTGTCVSLLLFAMKPIIKDRMPKWFQSYTWFIVMIAFIVPFSKLVTLPANTTNFPIMTIDETVGRYIFTVEEEPDPIIYDFEE